MTPTPTPSAFREIARTYLWETRSPEDRSELGAWFEKAIQELAPRIAALVSENRIINELVAENEKLHTRIGEMEGKS